MMEKLSFHWNCSSSTELGWKKGRPKRKLRPDIPLWLMHRVVGLEPNSPNSVQPPMEVSGRSGGCTCSRGRQSRAYWKRNSFKRGGGAGQGQEGMKALVR